MSVPASLVAITRRQALAGLAASALRAAMARAQGAASARVVIIGGGFGGASAARTLREVAPAIDVTLIEPSRRYIACPFSNLVVGGLREISAQGFGYGAIAASGVRVIEDYARSIDPAARSVTLESGTSVSYDRLIVSPGIDIRWGALDGYGRTAIRTMPHAWKAGAQTVLLRQQLREMDDGGTVVMSVPPAPYRCPPGPYERASLIAHYLKTEKPRSKLIVLDAKDSFSKKPLFQDAWATLYPDHLEWRGASDDGRVSRVDPETRTFETDFGTLTADVANVIPPQQAASIAIGAGIADNTGWCPVEPVSFESTLQPGIHVIGDAAIMAPMPKSAFAANAQGKVCALQVARFLAGEAPAPAVLANTCYSYVAPEQAVSVVGVYRPAGDAFTEVPGAGGTSPLEHPPGDREAEAAQAAHWFDTVTREAFG
ncbi:MAG: FCSD flavin-binding domain-containing protein [Pseudomonadota bacterium]